MTKTERETANAKARAEHAARYELRKIARAATKAAAAAKVTEMAAP